MCWLVCLRSQAFSLKCVRIVYFPCSVDFAFTCSVQSTFLCRVRFPLICSQVRLIFWRCACIIIGVHWSFSAGLTSFVECSDIASYFVFFVLVKLSLIGHHSIQIFFMRRLLFDLMWRHTVTFPALGHEWTISFVLERPVLTVLCFNCATRWIVQWIHFGSCRREIR